jgi:hypothetical protein
MEQGIEPEQSKILSNPDDCFEQGLIVTKRGLVNKYTYYFPQITVDRFDGQKLLLKVTDKDAG